MSKTDSTVSSGDSDSLVSHGAIYVDLLFASFIDWLLLLSAADIDECYEDPDICPQFAKCVNFLCGYQCKCFRGFEEKEVPYVRGGTVKICQGAIHCVAILSLSITSSAGS